MTETLSPSEATCIGYAAHRPPVPRIDRHHVLPKVAGGKTVKENLAPLCPNCHVAVHGLLYQLKLHGTEPGFKLTEGTKKQRQLAARGYEAAVAAGTVARIPDEGA